jgi:hypothetical protein
VDTNDDDDDAVAVAVGDDEGVVQTLHLVALPAFVNVHAEHVHDDATGVVKLNDGSDEMEPPINPKKGWRRGKKIQ